MCPQSQPATAYVTEDQYQRWKDEAEELGMTISEFIAAMVEAGLKKFEVTVVKDESYRSLREQRNDLKEQLEICRDRISKLENQLYDQERETIEEFVEANPGTSFDAILQHVVDSAPKRVNNQLHALEGREIRVETDRYYPLSEDGSDRGEE